MLVKFPATRIVPSVWIAAPVTAAFAPVPGLKVESLPPVVRRRAMRFRGAVNAPATSGLPVESMSIQFTESVAPVEMEDVHDVSRAPADSYRR